MSLLLFNSDVLRVIIVDFLPLTTASSLYETGHAARTVFTNEIGNLVYIWKAQLRLRLPLHHIRPAWHVCDGKLVRKSKRAEIHEMLVDAAFSDDTWQLQTLIGHCPTAWLSDACLGVTALHVVRGVRAAWLLCTAGARLDARDRHGRTPMDFFAASLNGRRVLLDFFDDYLWGL